MSRIWISHPYVRHVQVSCRVMCVCEKKFEGDNVSVLFRCSVRMCVCVKRIEGADVGVNPTWVRSRIYIESESCLTCKWVVSHSYAWRDSCLRFRVVGLCNTHVAATRTSTATHTATCISTATRYTPHASSGCAVHMSLPYAYRLQYTPQHLPRAHWLQHGTRHTRYRAVQYSHLCNTYDQLQHTLQHAHRLQHGTRLRRRWAVQYITATHIINCNTHCNTAHWLQHGTRHRSDWAVQCTYHCNTYYQLQHTLQHAHWLQHGTRLSVTGTVLQSMCILQSVLQLIMSVAVICVLHCPITPVACTVLQSMCML